MHHLRPDDQIHVSVIIPAFNMELYVEQCLRSLFEQTIDRLEVIVVDDGSTDRTSDVVKSLTPPDGKSLRLISKSNGGLSSARNAGMRAARGRWIGFVDADDWVAGTMFSLLVSEAESAGADLAIARNVRVDAVSGAQEASRDFSLWKEFIASHGRRANPRNCPDLFCLIIPLAKGFTGERSSRKSDFPLRKGLYSRISYQAIKSCAERNRYYWSTKRYISIVSAVLGRSLAAMTILSSMLCLP